MKQKKRKGPKKRNGKGRGPEAWKESSLVLKTLSLIPLQRHHQDNTTAHQTWARPHLSRPTKSLHPHAPRRKTVAPMHSHLGVPFSAQLDFHSAHVTGRYFVTCRELPVQTVRSYSIWPSTVARSSTVTVIFLFSFAYTWFHLLACGSICFICLPFWNLYLYVQVCLEAISFCLNAFS